MVNHSAYEGTKLRGDLTSFPTVQYHDVSRSTRPRGACAVILCLRTTTTNHSSDMCRPLAVRLHEHVGKHRPGSRGVLFDDSVDRQEMMISSNAR